MSNISHRTPLTTQIGEHRRIALAGLLALLATIAVVLVLAIGDDSTSSSDATSLPAGSPVARADGGPEETGVAAAIAPKPAVTAPDESNVAAAVGAGRDSQSGPSRPDESVVANAISGQR
jgi:hypothetical protein